MYFDFPKVPECVASTPATALFAQDPLAVSPSNKARAHAINTVYIDELNDVPTMEVPEFVEPTDILDMTEPPVNMNMDRLRDNDATMITISPPAAGPAPAGCGIMHVDEAGDLY